MGAFEESADADTCWYIASDERGYLVVCHCIGEHCVASWRMLSAGDYWVLWPLSNVATRRTAPQPQRSSWSSLPLVRHWKTTSQAPAGSPLVFHRDELVELLVNPGSILD